MIDRLIPPQYQSVGKTPAPLIHTAIDKMS
jgi:hypothetical protein